MANEPDEAAARLEAALERIARLAQAAPPGRPAGVAGAVPRAELVARLDRMIERLRGALDQGP
jgi:hypothetical protein